MKLLDSKYTQILQISDTESTEWSNNGSPKIFPRHDVPLLKKISKNIDKLECFIRKIAFVPRTTVIVLIHL